MIKVDDRAGSSQLHPLLLQERLPAKLTRLDFGDVAFHGRGPGDRALRIGVEYKTLSDILGCITSGRYAAHQLPGMQANYDVHFLLIEGIWRTGNNGVVEVRRGKEWTALRLGGRYYMGCDLDGFLLSMTIQGGTRIKQTAMLRESVAWLVALNKWWTGKSWEAHISHQTFNLSGPAVGMVEPPFERRVAKELPGIGWVKSASVVQALPSMALMAAAEEEDWRQIPGIGKGLAKQIVAAIHGYKE